MRIINHGYVKVYLLIICHVANQKQAMLIGHYFHEIVPKSWRCRNYRIMLQAWLNAVEEKFAVNSKIINAFEQWLLGVFNRYDAGCSPRKDCCESH